MQLDGMVINLPVRNAISTEQDKAKHMMQTIRVTSTRNVLAAAAALALLALLA